jgi:hypothetical protein
MCSSWLWRRSWQRSEIQRSSPIQGPQLHGLGRCHLGEEDHHLLDHSLCDASPLAHRLAAIPRARGLGIPQVQAALESDRVIDDRSPPLLQWCKWVAWPAPAGGCWRPCSILAPPTSAPACPWPPTARSGPVWWRAGTLDGCGWGWRILELGRERWATGRKGRWVRAEASETWN